MVNVRQIRFNNETYLTVLVTPRSFKNLDGCIYKNTEEWILYPLSSQSTSDCHTKGLRWARKFGNIFLKRNLHFVIYGCVLKLKVILFLGKFSFYLVWVNNVSHYLLLNTSVWFIMGDNRCLCQLCFHRACPISFGGLRCLLLSRLCRSRKAGDVFGVVFAWVKGQRTEQPPSAGCGRMGRGKVVPASSVAVAGDPSQALSELKNGSYSTWHSQT